MSYGAPCERGVGTADTMPTRDMEAPGLIPDVGEVELAPKGFLFPALDPGEAILGQPGHFRDTDDEVDVPVPTLAEFDGHIAEQALVPQVAHGFAQPVAGNEDLIAHLEAAEELDRLNISKVRPQHRDAGDAVLGRDLEVNRRDSRLCPQGAAPKQARTKEGDR